MKKLSNLLSDVKIVEKRKWIFLAPVFVAVFALIMSLIFYFVSGSALNLGMDFVGGYTINVDVGAKLTDENTDDYKSRVTNIVEAHDVKVSQILVTGTGDDTALQIRFKSIDGDNEMEEIVSSIIDEIKKDVTVIRPVITDNGNGTYTADYGLPVYQVSDEISAVFASTEGVSGLTFATDEFAKVFDDFSDRYAQYMIAQNKVYERMLAFLPIPTNTDMKSLYRTVYDLRKEVRDLKKAVAALEEKGGKK